MAAAAATRRTAGRGRRRTSLRSIAILNSPFDPIPRLATYLHPSVCPDASTEPAGDACPIALAAARRWRDELHGGGLAVVPLDVVTFIKAQFDLALEDGADDRSGTGDLAGPPKLTEAEAGEPPAATADLYLSPTLLVCRHRDGSEERLGPWARSLAEAILVDFNWTHDPAVVAARLEPEALWIGELLEGLQL